MEFHSPLAAVMDGVTAQNSNTADARKETHASWDYTDVQQCSGVDGCVMGCTLAANAGPESMHGFPLE